MFEASHVDTQPSLSRLLFPYMLYIFCSRGIGSEVACSIDVVPSSAAYSWMCVLCNGIFIQASRLVATVSIRA